MQHIFTWIPAYQNIVAILKTMRGNQSDLITALTQIGIDVRQDESSPGIKIAPTEIDPFTFICYLNIFGDVRRKKVLRNLCRLWNISCTIDDVCGIPSVSGQKIWLFPYKYDRKNNEINRLWDFFEALLNNTITDEIFEDTLQIENVGPKKLTEVMFLVRPDLYLCLNSAVEPYLQQIKKINTSFSSYSSLKLVLNQIKSNCIETFPQLSYDGYLYREYSNKPINYFRLGSTDGNGGASMLPKMLENSTVNIGWADIGDIDYIEPNTRPGINQKMLSIGYYKDKKNQKSLVSRKAGEIYRFYSDLKPNDIVVVNDGYAVLAIGRIVTNNYFFIPDLEFPHSRLVEWIDPDVKNLSITGGNQTSVWQLEDEESINTIKDYLSKETKDKTGAINKQNSKIMGLNTILYGPPGTGKTHMLSEVIKDRKLIEIPQAKEANYDEFVNDYHWWQVIAMALLDVEGGIKVPELRKHPLIQAKYRNSILKSLDARLWSTMQHNSSDECKNVKLKKKLGGVRIFFKETDSSWRLEDKEDFKETYPDLIEEYGALTNPGAIGKEIRHYTFTTCHQSLAYEDFIEGIKPVITPEDDEEKSRELLYENRRGLFYQACDKAARRAGYLNLNDCLNDTKENRKVKFDEAIEKNNVHFMFLDEINRCNVAAVFGELITLIEDNKRLGGKNEIADTVLPYSQKLFGVPANLVIVGTMNTADRSVEALDTALRRRFSFEFMPPKPELLVDDKQQEIKRASVSLKLLLTTINNRISYLLDEDHQIGHSYFMNLKDEDDLKEAFKNKIIPLLKEYFYNDYGKIRMILGDGFVERIEENKSSPGFAIKDKDIDVDFGKVVYKIHAEGRPDFAAAIAQIIPV